MSGVGRLLLRAPTLLAAGAALATLLLAPGSPVRVIAGVLLVLPLPAWAIDRLITAEWDPDGAHDFRIAVAVGLALVADVAVGLLLAASPIGLTETPLAVGLFLVVTGLEGYSGTRSLRPAEFRRGLLLPAASAGLFIALGTTAFTIARGGAVAETQAASGIAASLVRSGLRYEVVLYNDASHIERASVWVVAHGARPARVTVSVGPRQRRGVFVAASSGTAGRDLKFRVAVAVDNGSQHGLTLNLTAPRATTPRPRPADRRKRHG